MNIKPISYAILSGLLLTASFPNISVSWLAWVALIPLLYGINRLSPAESFRTGFIAGMVHYLTLMYWLAYTMHTYGRLPWLLSIPVLVLLAAYLSVYVALFSALVTRLCPSPLRCLFMVPTVWVALEYIRSFLLSGFPWELVGYSQYQLLPVIQIADVTGVYGVSFLIGLSNSALLIAVLYAAKTSWYGRRIQAGCAATAVIVAAIAAGGAWGYGTWKIRSVDGQILAAPTSRVMIVQGNVDQSIKWDPAFQLQTTEKYIRLSLQASTQDTDLIVWPETATPFYFQQDLTLSGRVRKAIQDAGTCFLIGSPSFVQRGPLVEYYNSAYCIGPDGSVKGKYDKAHLVPFGEYVPFRHWLPFVGKLVQAAGDFSQGIRGDTISTDKAGLGVQICFEIIFPALSRAAVMNNAGFLVNITNDAWFGRTAAPWQHFSMAVFRAVENKRFLVRSANTGISGFVDPLGRVVASTSLYEEKTLAQPVAVLGSKTIYTRCGDIFAVACVAVAVASGIWYLYQLKFFRKTMSSNR